MDRGAWWVHGVAESDMTEQLTQHNTKGKHSLFINFEVLYKKF